MENNLFDEWNSIKKKLHNSNNLPNFSKGEIDELDFERIQEGFCKLFIKNFPKP